MALAGAEKSKTGFFFITSQLFMLLSLYSLYDEAFVRRPWKHFQSEFRRLEVQLAEKERDKITDDFVKKGTLVEIKKLELDLEEAVIAKESEEYRRLQEEGERLQVVFDDEELEVRFNKSILDAVYYEWKHARHEGHAYAEAEKSYHELTDEISAGNQRLKGLTGRLQEVKLGLSQYDERITQLQTQIDGLKKPLKEAGDKVKTIKAKINDISQVLVEDFGKQGNIYWGRVDRCQTCHIGVDKDGLDDVVAAFQLIVVADEKAVGEAVKKDPKLRGFVITEKQKQHFQIMYGAHPRREELLGAHPVKDFGCTACHGGEGRAINIKGLKFGDDVEEAQSKSHFVAGVFGERDFAHATHHHGIEPLLRGAQTEANCLGCHMGEIYIPEAKTLTKGLTLFIELGCNGCHLVKNYDNLFKVGPELNKVAAKVDKTWLVDWLKNPKNYMPNSRMPMFGLNDDEVVAVASYLVNNSQAHPHKFKATTALSGDVDKGKKLFETLGCLGCHESSSDEKTFARRSRAPNLSRLSSKIADPAWVSDWLKDPKNYAPHARMPSLRLTDEEAAHITSYLLSLNKDYREEIETRSKNLAGLVDADNPKLVKQGKRVISQRGCYSCHDIAGFEDLDRIAPELTGVALKETFELDFGDALSKNFTFTDVFGRTIFVAHEKEGLGEPQSEILAKIKKPDGVDRVTNLEETWQSYMRNKIQYPTDIYRHERVELKMPNFNLSDEEADALLAFLKGLKMREIPQKFLAASSHHRRDVMAGQRLIAEFNCLGCHSIQGYGGEINPKIDTLMQAELRQFYPPALDAVGEKLKPEWLQNFLHRPIKYRPQLSVRMPSFAFTENEVATLMAYFAGLSQRDLRLSAVTPSFNVGHLKAAQVLAGPEAYNCFSCHLLNGKTPGDDPQNWAPDWVDMRSRLQYTFITEWIKNPVKYQKFAVMPGFLNKDEEAHPDYLDGKAKVQLEALRDYILFFGENP